ncbi:MAG: hypothetical protein JSV84_00270 [Gemmatimonadota bacterium]|nr:MAG: hypothetical protein JSV84_00270 [Gemmatimonadota bacterium]
MKNKQPMKNIAPRFVVATISLVLILVSNCGKQKDPFQPENPYRVVSTFATPGYALEVYVVDTYAYVVDDQAGVWVLDVSDPEDPSFVTTIGHDQSATNVEAVHILEENNIALVADYDIGLLIYDVSTVDEPQLLNIAFDRDIEGTFGIDKGDTLFIFGADRHEGFKVNRYERDGGDWNWFFYNFYKRIPFAYGDALDVVASEEFAYVANDHIGLEIIDLSLPDSAAHIKTVDTPGGARALSLWDNHIYLAAYQRGIQIIDVSIPEEAEIVGSYEDVDRVVDVCVFNTIAYMADRDEGMVALDISNPSQPTLAGWVETPYAQGIFATDNYVYLVDRDLGLVIIAKE